MPATESPTRAKAANVQALLAEVRTKGRKLKPCVVVIGEAGRGKTSFSANAKGAVVLQTKGETGLETLIDHGQVKETAHSPEIQTYPEYLNWLDENLNGKHDYKTLVVDTINGAQDLCHQWVCDTEYGGDWGERGFTSYMRGYAVATPHWEKMLGILNEIREKRDMGIILCCHSKIATFKNPTGVDYDRYTADMHPKQWAVTHKFADIILFFDTVTVVTEGTGTKGKAQGGTQRVARCEHSATWDAKNRHGFPSEFSLGSSAAEGFTNFMKLFKKGKD